MIALSLATNVKSPYFFHLSEAIVAHPNDFAYYPKAHITAEIKCTVTEKVLEDWKENEKLN